MADTCPLYVGYAGGLVKEGWDFYRNSAISFRDVSLSLIENLASINPQPVNFAVTYDVPTHLLTPYQAPTAPTAPDLAFNEAGFHDPGDVPTVEVSEAKFDPVPAFTDKARPAIGKLNPGVFTGQRPDISFTPTAITTPDDPNIVNPDEPTLFEIVLPDTTISEIPEFTATAPQIDFSAPSGNILFQTRAYASTLLTDVRTGLSAMVQGQIGLPVAIERALFARARDREAGIARQAVDEAREEAANMGHSLPNGTLMARLAEARQNNANNASAANRDTTIKLAELDREFYHRAIERAVQLEGSLIDADIKLQDLEFRKGQAEQQIAIEIFNGNVSMFNARGQLYGVEGQVYRDRIAAIGLEIDQLKAKIDAQRLIGEVNKDLVSLYESRIRARNLILEQFKARWDAIKTITERDSQLLEQQRLKLQLYETDIDAYDKLWGVTLKQYDADAANGRLFESQVGAFAKRVDAVTAGNRNLIDQKTLELRAKEVQVTAWRGKLDRFIADVDAENKRVQSGATVFEGLARIYAAAGEIAKNDSDANARKVQIIIEGLRAKADLAMKNVEVAIQQLQQLTTLQVEGLRAASQNATQLTAGAMAAVNFGAHAQDSTSASNSSSCSVETRLSGSVDS